MMTEEKVEVAVETPEFVPTPLDNALSGAPVEEPVAVEAEEAQEETTEETESKEEVAEVEEKAPEVPVAALQAERQAKQAAITRADALQQKLDDLTKAPEEEKKDFFDDPEGAIESLKTEMRTESDTKILNAMMDVTRETIGGEEFDAKVAIFNEAAAKDPSLMVKVQGNNNPVLAAYKEGKRLEAFQEIGDDPAAYKETLKAEALAEAKAELKAEAEKTKVDQKAEDDKVKDKLPVDIANENSSGGRGNSFTGPTPLGAVLKGNN